MKGMPAMTIDASATAEYGLRARLQAVLPQMSPSMANAAQMLLEQPELPIRLSIGEFAERANVSAPTVTRLCKFLGYSGYPGLRVGAAAELGRTASVDALVGQIDTTARPEMSDSDIVRTFLASHIKALQASADLIDLSHMREAADLIANANHIDVYGVGASGAVAEVLANRLYQLGLNVRAWTDVHMGLMSAAILPLGAVAIGISSSGQTHDTIEMLELARERNAATIAVTSSQHSPLAERADIVIRTAPRDDFLDIGVFTASHVQIFATNLLYLLVSWHRREHIARYEREAKAALAPRRSGRSESVSIR